MENVTYADSEAHRWLSPGLCLFPWLQVLTIVPAVRPDGGPILAGRELGYSDRQMLNLMTALWRRTNAAVWTMEVEIVRLPFTVTVPPDMKLTPAGRIFLSGSGGPDQSAALARLLPLCHQWRICFYGSNPDVSAGRLQNAGDFGGDMEVEAGTWLPVVAQYQQHDLAAVVEQSDPFGPPAVVAQITCPPAEFAQRLNEALSEPVYLGSAGIAAVYSIVDGLKPGLNSTGLQRAGPSAC